MCLGALIGVAVIVVVIVFERRSDELKLLRARVHDLESEFEVARLPERTPVARAEGRSA